MRKNCILGESPAGAGASLVGSRALQGSVSAAAAGRGHFRRAGRACTCQVGAIQIRRDFSNFGESPAGAGALFVDPWVPHGSVAAIAASSSTPYRVGWAGSGGAVRSLHGEALRVQAIRVTFAELI